MRPKISIVHTGINDLDGHLWEVMYNPFACVGPAEIN